MPGLSTPVLDPARTDSTSEHDASLQQPQVSEAVDVEAIRWTSTGHAGGCGAICLVEVPLRRADYWSRYPATSESAVPMIRQSLTVIAMVVNQTLAGDEKRLLESV